MTRFCEEMNARLEERVKKTWYRPGAKVMPIKKRPAKKVAWARCGPIVEFKKVWTGGSEVGAHGIIEVERDEVVGLDIQTSTDHIHLIGPFRISTIDKLLGRITVDRSTFRTNGLQDEEELRSDIGMLYFPDKYIRSDEDLASVVATLTKGFKPEDLIHGVNRNPEEEEFKVAKDRMREDLGRNLGYSQTLKLLENSRKILSYDYSMEIKKKVLQTWMWSRKCQMEGRVGCVKKINISPALQSIIGRNIMKKASREEVTKKAVEREKDLFASIDVWRILDGPSEQNIFTNMGILETRAIRALVRSEGEFIPDYEGEDDERVVEIVEDLDSNLGEIGNNDAGKIESEVLENDDTHDGVENERLGSPTIGRRLRGVIEGYCSQYKK